MLAIHTLYGEYECASCQCAVAELQAFYRPLTGGTRCWHVTLLPAVHWSQRALHSLFSLPMSVLSAGQWLCEAPCLSDSLPCLQLYLSVFCTRPLPLLLLPVLLSPFCLISLLFSLIPSPSLISALSSVSPFLFLLISFSFSHCSFAQIFAHDMTLVWLYCPNKNNLSVHTMLILFLSVWSWWLTDRQYRLSSVL